MPKAAVLTALMVITSTVIAPAAENDPFRPPAMEVTGVPAIPKLLMDQLRQYQSVRTAGFRGWAPDGKGILIQTQFGNTSQLHRVYTPGGRREQMTFLDEPTDGTFLKGRWTARCCCKCPSAATRTTSSCATTAKTAAS